MNRKIFVSSGQACQKAELLTWDSRTISHLPDRPVNLVSYEAKWSVRGSTGQVTWRCVGWWYWSRETQLDAAGHCWTLQDTAGQCWMLSLNTNMKMNMIKIIHVWALEDGHMEPGPEEPHDIISQCSALGVWCWWQHPTTTGQRVTSWHCHLLPKQLMVTGRNQDWLALKLNVH